MKIGKKIALAAKEAGICDPYFTQMKKQVGIGPLCEMFFKGSDWAMKKDFPPLETLRQFKGSSEQYGLYTDFTGMAETAKVAVFGNSLAGVEAAGFDVREIYVRHHSKLNLSVKDNAIVIVNLLDEAILEIENEGLNTVMIYCYGDSARVEGGGNFEIKPKSIHGS